MSKPNDIEDGEETLPEGVPSGGKKKAPRGGVNTRIAKQHLPVIHVTPTQLRDHFTQRDRVMAENLLLPLRRQFAIVENLAVERDALKTQVATLEGENAALKAEIESLKKAAEPKTECK